MALLAEELVEEWLNRQGFFTIRGIKLGVHEIDLLALRVTENAHELRHLEVQASVHPISYISRVPKAVQKETGRAAASAKKRTPEELAICVQEWIEKKFELPRKVRVRQQLAKGTWSRELVVHQLRHPDELEVFRSQGILVHYLKDVVHDLANSETIVPAASGSAFADLVLMGEDVAPERGAG